MTLSEIQTRCYEQAKAKGWTDKVVPVPEMIALIHSEASEALESYRNGEGIDYIDEDGKPQGIASEFADIIIRLGHYASVLGFDLETAVVKKLDYNLTRAYRHGGKLI